MGRLELVQPLLKLLGVYFVIDGGAQLLGRLVHAASVFRMPFLADPLFSYLATLIYPTAILIAGLYLVVDGRWIIEKIFMPARQEGSEESDSEPPGGQVQ